MSKSWICRETVGFVYQKLRRLHGDIDKKYRRHRIDMYPFLSKYFVKGLTIGGVKG